MWPWRRRTGGDGGWTSVVAAGQAISVARVERQVGKRPAVTFWQSFHREGTDVEALKRLKAAGHLGAGACTLLLDHGQYQLLQTEAPAVPREEMAAALRWRVKDMVDFPVEQANVDVLPIPAGESGRRPAQVHVVVASRAVLTPAVRMFQDARVRLDVIDIPELAQRNVAALFETQNRALAMLAFDANGGRLTFTYGGELCASRRIDLSATALAESTAEGIQYDRVLLDVQRSMDNFDRGYSAVSLSGLVVVPVPGAAGLVDHLRGNLYQKVEEANLGEVLDLTRVPGLAEPARQAQALLAIGAALREEAGA